MTPPTTTARELAERIAVEICDKLLASIPMTRGTKTGFPGRIAAIIDSALGPLVADRERLDWLDGISVRAFEPEPFRWNIRWSHNEANIRDGVDAARAIDASKNAGKGA